MASTKHGLPSRDDEPRFKKVKFSQSEPSQSVVLNPADSDIDFDVEGKGLQGSALYEEGFAYCWSGARANIGITRGKYCFGCKVISAQPVDMKDTPLDQQHVCRVGFSIGGDPLRNLGETIYSFGYGGTGKFSNSGLFSDYGEKFGVGDTIICAVHLENSHMASIGFSKNGKWLGDVKNFEFRKLQCESALFPHVLLKNVVVQMQFSVDDGLIPEQGYKPWDAAILDGNTVMGPASQNQCDCEVIMMVGLPASGKTTWAEKWVIEHPEKRYVLLGTNLALEQMKVPGLLRKNNYGERFEHLMDHATKIFNVLLSRASKISRNFIIDQTNVSISARKRKLKPFASYMKIAAVVFPRAEELKNRAKQRFKEMVKEVPSEAVNEMLANFTLPMSKDMPGADEYFDQVLFVELSRDESQRSLDDMKRDITVNPFMTPYSRESSLASCSSSSLGHSEAPVMLLAHSQGIGDCNSSSYSSQPLSRASPGSYYLSSPSNGPSLISHHTGSFDEYDYTRINGPEHHPSTSSLPYNTWDDRCTNGYGDTPYSPPMSHSATPSAYGSYGTQVSEPPFQTFPNNGQVYPQTSTPRPPSVNFPFSVQHPGFYPPPGPGY